MRLSLLTESTTTFVLANGPLYAGDIFKLAKLARCHNVAHKKTNIRGIENGNADAGI